MILLSEPGCLLHWAGVGDGLSLLSLLSLQLRRPAPGGGTRWVRCAQPLFLQHSWVRAHFQQRRTLRKNLQALRSPTFFLFPFGLQKRK